VSKVIEVRSIRAQPGELAWGLLPVAELIDGVTTLTLPVVVLNGAHEGPTLYINAGSHGGEGVPAIEVLRQLLRIELQADSLRGAIIAVPVANPLAAQARSRVTPDLATRDGTPFAGDLHLNFPGKPDGSLTQRIAHVIWQNCVEQADYVMDYHFLGSASNPGTFLYQGASKNVKNSPAWQKSLEMAKALGLTVYECAPTPGTLAGLCVERGTPAIFPEIWDAPLITPQAIRVGVRGALNVLKHLQMFEGELEPHSEIPPVPGVYYFYGSVRAQRGGIIVYEQTPGHPLSRGAIIARIYNAFGELVEECTMPIDGHVITFSSMTWIGVQAVGAGDGVADIAVPLSDIETISQ
jgi:predicted deacylase